MENQLEPPRIEIGEKTLKHLDTLRKWTMFLSISGFIFFGLIISLGLITGTFLTAFNHSDTTRGVPDSLLLIIFFSLALIYFFPVLFLFRFSKHTSKAISTLNNTELHKAFKYLKRFFAYLGVLLIIVFIFYIAALVVAGTSMAFLKGLG
jgi:hypothetical protein